MHFCERKINISRKVIPKEDPINNNPALVKIMALRRIGDKPTLTRFTDAYMRHNWRSVKLRHYYFQYKFWISKNKNDILDTTASTVLLIALND